MNMMAVPFHGNSLYVVNHNGEPYVPMKPVVAGMGLAWQSQLAKTAFCVNYNGNRYGC